MRPLRTERGDASVLILVAGLITAITLGLVYDLGGTAVRARTEAATAAREAARAAGQELSGQAQTNGQVAIDTAAAAASARTFLSRAGVPGTVSVSGTTITVTTRVERPSAFLALLGTGSMHGTGRASASPETGDAP